jgi:hypothetical protein
MDVLYGRRRSARSLLLKQSSSEITGYFKKVRQPLTDKDFQ